MTRLHPAARRSYGLMSLALLALVAVGWGTTL